MANRIERMLREAMVNLGLPAPKRARQDVPRDVITQAQKVIDTTISQASKPLLFEGVTLNEDEQLQSIAHTKDLRGKARDVAVSRSNLQVVYTIQADNRNDLWSRISQALQKESGTPMKADIELYVLVATTKHDQPARTINPMIYSAMLDHPLPVRTPQQQAHFMAQITEERIIQRLETVHQPTPASRGEIPGGSSTTAIGLIKVVLTLTRKKGAVSSATTPLPSFFRMSRHIITWSGKDALPHLCFWYCLAYCMDSSRQIRCSRYERSAISLYEQHHGTPYSPSTAVPTDLEDVPAIIERFKIQLKLWNFVRFADGDRLVLQEHNHPMVQPGEQVHNLLVYNDHIMNITRIEPLTKAYHCGHCDQQFVRIDFMKDHQKECSDKIVHTIPTKTNVYGGKKMNDLVKLAYKFDVPLSPTMPWIGDISDVPFDLDPLHDWFVAYDIETMQPNDEDTPVQSDPSRMTYDREHHMASICLKTSTNIGLPAITLSVLREKSLDEVNRKAVAYLEQAWTIACNMADQKWGAWVEEIKQKLDPYYYAKVKKMSVDAKEVFEQKYPGLSIDDIVAVKIKNAMSKIYDYIYQLPVVGFNSSRFDLACLIKEGFLAALLKHDPTRERAEPIKDMKGQGAFGYKKIATERFVFLDVLSYLGPTRLEKFCNDFLKVRREAEAKASGQPVVKHTKMLFPYEAMTSEAWLKSTEEIPWEAFNSTLKGVNPCMPPRREWVEHPKRFAKYLEETEDWQKNRERFTQQVKAAKDRDLEKWRLALLEDYNRGDVDPFVEATEILIKAYWDNEGIVMFKDALGAPGIAETVLTQTQIRPALEADQQLWTETTANYTPQPLDPKKLREKQDGYFKQDEKYGVYRERLPADAMQRIYDAHAGCCRYCYNKCPDTWTMDRLMNDQPHTEDNLVLACESCNSARKRKNAYLFWREKALERQAERCICVLGIDDKKAQPKRKDFVLDLRRRGIVGGFSGTHHRHLKVGDPLPTKVVWDPSAQKWVQAPRRTMRQIQSIFGADFCNLYPSSYLFDMPAGKGEVFEVKPEESEALLQKIITDREHVYIVRCDGSVPEALYDEFAPWPPFVVNSGLVTWDMLSPTQQQYERDEARRRNVQLNESTWGDHKLCQVMRFQQLFECSDSIRWYIEHGLKIENITLCAKFKAARPIAAFTKRFCKLRKEAKEAGNSVYESLFKLIPNSSWGRFAMNAALYIDSKVINTDVNAVYKHVERKTFKRLQIFDANGTPTYVVENSKKKIVEEVPLHAAFLVLKYSKLRMLRWIYDFLFRYVDRDRLQIAFSDTDSIYIAFGHELDIEDERARTDLATYVRPELLQEYLTELYARVPPDDKICSTVAVEVFSLERQQWETHQVTRVACTEEEKRSVVLVWNDGKWVPEDMMQRYEAGRMLIEWHGTQVLSLNSKVYVKYNDIAIEMKAKGIKPRDPEEYQTVMETKETHRVNAVQFRVNPSTRRMCTATIPKDGLTARYTKAYMFEDSVQLAPFIELR